MHRSTENPQTVECMKLPEKASVEMHTVTVRSDDLKQVVNVI